MERTREYWIYQKRNVSDPWAIQCIVTFTRTKQIPFAYRFDVIVYADWIPGYHSDSSCWNKVFANGDDFCSAILDVLAKYGHGLTFDDETQLAQSFINIISEI